MGTGGETLIERNSGNTLIVRNTDNTSTSNLGHVILERGDGSGDDFSITTMSDLANGVDKIGFTFGTSINAVINKTGEVGIGETNPTNKLSIGTNLGTGYGISVNSGSPYGGIIETLEATPSSNPAFWVRNTDGTNTSHLFRVQNNGNVGVGTISPNVQLHIESNFPLVGFSDLDDLTDINDIAYIRGQANGLSMGWYDASTNTYATQTHLDGVTGNFGINTTTPTNKLDINGDLRIQTITPGSGADVALVADATGIVKQVAPNPVGEIIIFPVTTPPTGYLICDGSAISRTTYSDLFTVLGTSYGPGDGSTTFNLPDLRGEFVRGSDNGRGADTGRVIGSWQTGTKVTNDNGSAPAVHTIANINQNSVDPTDINMLIYYNAAGTSTTAGSTFVGMVRPRNVAMNYCIRF